MYLAIPDKSDSRLCLKAWVKVSRDAFDVAWGGCSMPAAGDARCTELASTMLAWSPRCLDGGTGRKGKDGRGSIGCRDTICVGVNDGEVSTGAVNG